MIDFKSLIANEIGMDLIYSFVIILCSLMIYFSTKEVYELSSHKGIKYFREAFLFFAIAYFFRYFIQFIFLFLNIREIRELSFSAIGIIPLFILFYSSSMAIFYLLYSVMWKKWENSRLKIYLFNILAIFIGFVGVLLRDIKTYLILNVILLLFILFILFIANKDSKKKEKGNHLYVIYLMLFIFWILNIIEILTPKFLEVYRVLIYLISIGIFMSILYKVVKKIGN